MRRRSLSRSFCAEAVTRGNESGERVACAIYERRPTPCREFSPGSPECLVAREEAGLPP